MLMLVGLVFVYFEAGPTRAGDILPGGSISSGNRPPEFNSDRVGSPINDFRDPSQYRAPTTPSSPPEPKPEPVTGGTAVNTSTSNPLIFQMTSTLHGDGNFSEWRSVNDGAKFRSKQASSAKNGSLQESKRFVFAREGQIDDFTSYRSAVTSSVEDVLFLGSSYRERVDHRNQDDLVRQTFTTGAISKRATYFGWLDIINSTGDGLDIGHDNRTMIYGVESQYVGISDLNARLTDRENSKSEISEQFAGRIAWNLNLKSIVNLTFKNESDHWLPCCYGGWFNTSLSDRKGIGGEGVFDCRCGNYAPGEMADARRGPVKLSAPY
jgi:hypothetical protein